MNLVAGVDSSTQSCKVELRRLEDGVRVGIGAAPHQRTFPPESRQDPRSWWDALSSALGAAMTNANADASRIRGISIGAQCHGLVALDRHGQPLFDAPLWNDTTSAEAASHVREDYGLAAWMRDVGVAPSSALTIMKLAQLAKTDPAIIRQISRVMVPHDYLTFRLTGHVVTDRSDAAGTGFYDVHRNVWRPELLERFVSADRDWNEALPQVLGPTEVAGTVKPEVARELGLREDTLVGPGGGDQHLAAVGLGLRTGDLGVSLGTSGVVFTPRRASVIDTEGLVDSVADATGGYLPLVCTLNAAKVTDTFARLLGVDPVVLGEMALSAPRKRRRATLVAYLDGERTPPEPDGTGVLGGITTATTREEIALASYEGVVAGIVGAYASLRRIGVDGDGEVVVTGGGARSLAYRQILADELGRPVTRRDSDEATARGGCVQIAAILTGMGVQEVATAWAPPTTERTAPRPHTDVDSSIDQVYYGQLRGVGRRPHSSPSTEA